MPSRSIPIVCLAVVLTTAAADERKFDVIVLKNKERLEGLIVYEDRDAVRFKYVVRKPGNRTLVFPTTFSRAEIDRIDRVADAERKDLTNWLHQLAGRIESEAARRAVLTLVRVPWMNNGEALQYAGKHFSLISNAREDIVRQVVVRLEDIFNAYENYLRPARNPDRQTQIILYRTFEEYKAFAKQAGLDLLNPAYYDRQRNQIVAASNLESLAGELDRLRQKHEALLQELRGMEKKMREHFRNQPPPALIAQVRDIRRRVEMVNNENECAFDRANSRLFATLYHEAFHAYLDNFVFSSPEMTLPRWLNEGLAQIFETALVETGELRVGQIDAVRLIAVKEAVRNKTLVPLHELLCSDEKPFLVNHMSEAQGADRHFLASWALAYYLAFDRKLLGSPALEEYALATHRGSDRLDAFRELVGQPLAEFESRFHRFILDLRPDGSTRSR